MDYGRVLYVRFLFVYLCHAICGMFFQDSIFGSSDVYGADDSRGFSVCGRDDRALCTSRRVDSLIAWLWEGLEAFGVCLALFGYLFVSKG